MLALLCILYMNISVNLHDMETDGGSIAAAPPIVDVYLQLQRRLMATAITLCEKANAREKNITVKMLGCLVCSSRGPSQVLGCGPGCQRCTALLTVAKITIATRGAALSGQPYDEVGTLGTSAYNTPILAACGVGDVLFLLLLVLTYYVSKLACCCCCYRYESHHRALQWREKVGTS